MMRALLYEYLSVGQSSDTLFIITAIHCKHFSMTYFCRFFRSQIKARRKFCEKSVSDLFKIAHSLMITLYSPTGNSPIITSTSANNC